MKVHQICDALDEAAAHAAFAVVAKGSARRRRLRAIREIVRKVAADLGDDEGEQDEPARTSYPGGSIRFREEIERIKKQRSTST